MKYYFIIIFAFISSTARCEHLPATHTYLFVINGTNSEDLLGATIHAKFYGDYNIDTTLTLTNNNVFEITLKVNPVDPKSVTPRYYSSAYYTVSKKGYADQREVYVMIESDKSDRRTEIVRMIKSGYVDKGWHLVTEFHGHGIVTTDDFTIRKRKWRATWRATESVDGNMMFLCMAKESGGNWFEGIANVAQSDAGSSVIRNKGEMYFRIEGFNCDWFIVVEESD